MLNPEIEYIEKQDLRGWLNDGEFLQRADLGQSRLIGANLPKLDFEEASLQGADLRYANLAGAILEEVDLENANLTGVCLAGANLAGANLTNALVNNVLLVRANLRGACLKNATLRYTSLRSADITDANFSGADLRRANLKGTHGTLASTIKFTDRFFSALREERDNSEKKLSETQKNALQKMIQQLEELKNQEYPIKTEKQRARLEGAIRAVIGKRPFEKYQFLILKHAYASLSRKFEGADLRGAVVSGTELDKVELALINAQGDNNTERGWYTKVFDFVKCERKAF